VGSNTYHSKLRHFVFNHNGATRKGRAFMPLQFPQRHSLLGAIFASVANRKKRTFQW
jgi:hypothetical protein